MEPTLLIASPHMKDPFFERTVVLVWHHDEDGAIGVVVNRQLEHTLQEVLDLDEPPADLQAQLHRVVWGGPVQNGAGTVVTRGAVPEDEGWTLPMGLSVTRSQDALLRLLEDGSQLILCLGYAGWGPGQLQKEIETGGWLWTDADPALIFEDGAEECYDRALATLGLSREMIWMQPVSE